MVVRFVAALVLGAVIGIERELVRKETGIRTSMTVAGGAALFAIIGLTLPYIAETPANGAGFAVIASVVAGIGFLGAGIIIKTDEHVHGLTTAALIWTTAAIGTLAGIGLIKFAAVATAILAFSLYTLRKLNVVEHIHDDGRDNRKFDKSG